MSLFFYFYRKVCGGVERMRKYRVWLTAALVINLVVLFGFVMNCYQTRKNEVDQRADEGVGGCSQADSM